MRTDLTKRAKSEKSKFAVNAFIEKTKFVLLLSNDFKLEFMMSICTICTYNV